MARAITGIKWVYPSQAEDHGAEELVPVLDVGVGEEEAQEDDRDHKQDGHDSEVQEVDAIKSDKHRLRSSSVKID